MGMVNIVSTKFSKLLFAATCPRVLSIRQHLLSGCESVSSTRSLSLTSFQSGCWTLRLPAELPRSKVIRHQEVVWPLVFAAFAFHSIFRTLSIGSILTSLPSQPLSSQNVQLTHFLLCHTSQLLLPVKLEQWKEDPSKTDSAQRRRIDIFIIEARLTQGIACKLSLCCCKRKL